MPAYLADVFLVANTATEIRRCTETRATSNVVPRSGFAGQAAASHVEVFEQSMSFAEGGVSFDILPCGDETSQPELIRLTSGSCDANPVSSEHFSLGRTSKPPIVPESSCSSALNGSMHTISSSLPG